MSSSAIPNEIAGTIASPAMNGTHPRDVVQWHAQVRQYREQPFRSSRLWWCYGVAIDDAHTKLWPARRNRFTGRVQLAWGGEGMMEYGTGSRDAARNFFKAGPIFIEAAASEIPQQRAANAVPVRDRRPVGDQTPAPHATPSLL